MVVRDRPPWDWGPPFALGLGDATGGRYWGTLLVPWTSLNATGGPPFSTPLY
jgi:hypothetical protein